MKIEELIAVALQFRAQKLWETLDDSMIFAVRLPDEDIAYCCVMGHGGEHYALGVYKGVTGLATYMSTVNHAVDADPFEAFLTYDCLNCDFENASQSNLSPQQKKLIKTVAAERNIKMCRSKAYPEFIRYNLGLIRTELNETEMADLEMALRAGIEVASRVKGMSMDALIELGFDDSGRYISMNGKDKVPFLEMQSNGSFAWSEIITPKVDKIEFKSPIFKNGVDIGKFITMKQTGAICCKVMHMRAPVKSEEGIYYPIMILILNENGMMFPVMQRSDKHNCEDEVLEQFSAELISMNVRPAEIFVDDGYSEVFLADFCKKTGIELTRVDFLPELENVVYMLHSSLGR